jgi:hypothetical protein
MPALAQVCPPPRSHRLSALVSMCMLSDAPALPPAVFRDLIEYTCNEDDDKWLHAFNASKKRPGGPLSLKVFEMLMDSFEKAAEHHVSPLSTTHVQLSTMQQCFLPQPRRHRREPAQPTSPPRAESPVSRSSRSSFVRVSYRRAVRRSHHFSCQPVGGAVGTAACEDDLRDRWDGCPGGVGAPICRAGGIHLPSHEQKKKLLAVEPDMLQHSIIWPYPPSPPLTLLVSTSPRLQVGLALRCPLRPPSASAGL